VDAIELVPEGRVCRDMIELYQSDGIVAEPAGALSVAALENIASDIHGKTVVCVISGGNNDISRYAEVLERSLIYQGLKHYFIVEFSQRPGALRAFVDRALGATDDITLFEYVKKNNRETGPALVGIELAKREDLAPLLERMAALNIAFELIRHDSPLFRFIL
jgi:threonine dehydratase